MKKLKQQGLLPPVVGAPVVQRLDKAKKIASRACQFDYKRQAVAPGSDAGTYEQCLVTGSVQHSNLDNAADREYSKAASHERKTIMTAAGGSYTVAEWLTLCAEYDDRCACCGLRDPLTVDHVRPVHLGGSSDISNIQPLCRHCNSSKGARHVDYRKS